MLLFSLASSKEEVVSFPRGFAVKISFLFPFLVPVQFRQSFYTVTVRLP
jgi:hypothetical protein